MKKNYFYPPQNFGALPEKFSEFKKARVVILPVGYEGTTSYKGGTKEGPRTIIEASGYLELYDEELGKEIHSLGIATLPDLEPVTTGPKQMIKRVYRVAKDILTRKKFLVMLGGEHSLTLGMVRAFAEIYPRMGVLQLDAHADLRDTYEGSPHNHACVMRRVSEICPVTGVGIRSLSQEEADYLKKKSPKIFWAQKIFQDKNWIAKVVATLPKEVYLTVDLDVFEPGIMVTGTPEPGGLGWYEVLGLLRQVTKKKKVVGFDVVELSPPWGTHTSAFAAAKLVYKLIGYCFY